MSRSTRVIFREIAPDPLYQSPKLAKLINLVMIDGKKAVAQTQVYGALERVKTTTKQDPLEVFHEAIRNITPQMEVRSRRVGGATYQVPVPVKPHRGFALAVRWLVAEANKRSNREYRTFADKLAAEILSAVHNEGGSIERKLTTHRQAEANRAFAHFKW